MPEEKIEEERITYEDIRPVFKIGFFIFIGLLIGAIYKQTQGCKGQIVTAGPSIDELKTFCIPEEFLNDYICENESGNCYLLTEGYVVPSWAGNMTIRDFIKPRTEMDRIADQLNWYFRDLEKNDSTPP